MADSFIDFRIEIARLVGKVAPEPVSSPPANELQDIQNKLFEPLRARSDLSTKYKSMIIGILFSVLDTLILSEHSFGLETFGAGLVKASSRSAFVRWSRDSAGWVRVGASIKVTGPIGC